MEELNFIQALGSFFQNLQNEFAASSHNHTASDISGLPMMLSGSDDPTAESCPPGCWYGQYE